MTIFLHDAQETLTFGQELAKTFPLTGVVALHGAMGMGKTTLVRGILQGLGWQGLVPSPTFTYLQEYVLRDRVVAHIDCYRIDTLEQGILLGLDEISYTYLCLVEWPEKIQDIVPQAWCTINITASGNGRELCIKSQKDYRAVDIQG
jgi:tRNA threonylcarbamoyladenosine biosynthesis protein TsaE